MSETAAQSEKSKSDTNLPAVPQKAPTETDISAAPQPLSYTTVRRRSRRRRRTIQPIDWRRLAILLGAFALCFLLVSERRLSSLIKQGVRQHIPALSNALRPELIALGICALILIYFVPGVEDRVLQFIKTKRNARRNQLRRNNRRRA